ncbi:hypothetical protein AAC387_Pa04g2818 [Persea americana]
MADTQLHDERMEHSQYKSADSNRNDEALEITVMELEKTGETAVMELARTKEELLRARETATQSWLDSKPLIDELEKLQSALTKARNRVSVATVTISTLESQLESTKTSIKAKEEEEFKAKRTIDEMNRVLDRSHVEIETLKLETDEERRARAKLKQELRLQRQSLRSLRLMQRAVRMESEAFGASAAAALRQIKSSKTENAFMELSHKDYDALKRKADEETALADWRVSVSMEQRHMAEASREKALRRLAELYAEKQSRIRHTHADEITEDDITKKAEKEEVGSPGEPEKAIVVRSKSLQHHFTLVNENEKFPTRGKTKQMMRRSKSSGYKKRTVKKKKPSILQQIQQFLVRNIRKFFG